MNNFIIINLQALTGTVAIILGFKYWIQPRISKLPIHEALLPFVYLNTFRYLGLSFMAKAPKPTVSPRNGFTSMWVGAGNL